MWIFLIFWMTPHHLCMITTIFSWNLMPSLDSSIETHQSWPQLHWARGGNVLAFSSKKVTKEELTKVCKVRGTIHTFIIVIFFYLQLRQTTTAYKSKLLNCLWQILHSHSQLFPTKLELFCFGLFGCWQLPQPPPRPQPSDPALECSNQNCVMGILTAAINHTSDNQILN